MKRLAQAVTNAVDVDDEDKAAHVAKHQKLVKDFHAVLKDFQKAQTDVRGARVDVLTAKGQGKDASYGTMDEESGRSRGGVRISRRRQVQLMQAAAAAKRLCAG